VKANKGMSKTWKEGENTLEKAASQEVLKRGKKKKKGTAEKDDFTANNPPGKGF